VNERNIFIVRSGEASLKGHNKPYFEKMLAERIRKLLRKFDGVEVRRMGGLIFIRTNKEILKADILKELSKVFGIASISPAVEVACNLEDIAKEAILYMNGLIEEQGVKTFKVEAKRADKNFPIQSPEIARIIGGEILKGCKVLTVDVHNPEVSLFIDVRSDITYIYQQKISGHGGLPLGTNGKGMILLSGGIDSPVAAWMMAKRGMTIEAIHFHSYPYTSERAQEKVEDLAGVLAIYCSRFKMHTINLLPIQEQIAMNCPEEEMTILLRRFMMRIAEEVARKNDCSMLITGESLGQVASQTAESIVVTDASVTMPVMRPLIAIDKVDIMATAREIGTFEISIQPYEDCCTVFLPKHPITKPRIERILASEEALDVAGLVAAAVDSDTVKDIYPAGIN
jgi:tRNA uracil 4-sulfurtransferase